jgi:UDP-N-acetylmuramate dehydrogenase
MLGEYFKKIYIEDNILEVGAAVGCTKLSTVAMDAELGGFEFLTGLPGTVGGAIKMNAGCYGAEISDSLVEFEAVSLSGNIKWFKKSSLHFDYRKSDVGNDIIITRAWFRGIADADYSIAKKTSEIVDKRNKSQPTNKRSCGSAFKNPPGKKAWELIKEAGCCGMKVGGAAISDKHCNFIINDNNATPDDIEDLGEKVIQKVYESSGIRLEWEIILLGER